MKFIAFDIETVPGDFDALSESQQEYLLRGASNDEEIAKKKGEMALTALTGKVVCIGLALCEYNSVDDSYTIEKKTALSMRSPSDSSEESEITLSDGTSCLLGDEAWLINTFWNILKKYNDASLISFNGRGFDAPFLMHRSAYHRIRPLRNLMDGTKFNYGRHFDLLDELTFFSPSSSGPTRRFNFDFYARAFGITSPKSEGVDGSKVSDLFHAGKVKEIAEYCLRDVVATWELFIFWDQYLNFKR